MRNPMQMQRFDPNGFMQMLQYCRISNKQSLRYWMNWFKRRFVQDSQKFAIKIIQRMSSAANFIMQVLTAAPYLSNSELDCSKLISMFSKLCLQFGFNLAGINSFVPEKFDDHSLIILHPKRTVNGF
jgi:hypothetical protein